MAYYISLWRIKNLIFLIFFSKLTIFSNPFQIVHNLCNRNPKNINDKNEELSALAVLSIVLNVACANKDTPVCQVDD